MATNMTYKKKTFISENSIKITDYQLRILPQWFNLHETMIEIYIAILIRESRAYSDFQRFPWAVSTVQHGFLRLLNSRIRNYLVSVSCQLREIYCSGASEDYFLLIISLKVIFYIFSLHIHVISLKALFMSFFSVKQVFLTFDILLKTSKFLFSQCVYKSKLRWRAE